MVLRRTILAIACFAAVFIGPTVWAAPVYNSTTGHYYERIDVTGMTWVQARAAAESRLYLGTQGHLVTINSSSEQQFLEDQFSAGIIYPAYWAGGHQTVPNSGPENDWQWVTGEPWGGYTNWYEGEPNDYGIYEEDALEIVTHRGWKWNDVRRNSSSELGGYFVEYPYTPVNTTPTNESPNENSLVQVDSSTPETPDRFIVFDGSGGWSPGGPIDSSKPTIVLSHGYASAYTNWPVDIADALTLKGTDANIVAWDWEDDAAQLGGIGLDLMLAGWKAPSHGEDLGDRLLIELGLDYDQPIHFIGHSLGTRVNKVAVDYMLDPNNSSLDASNTLASNTHITIFDAAEYEVVGEDLIPWSNPIPEDTVAYIDNYISAVGALHSEAVNVQLFTEMPDFSLNVFSFPIDYLGAFHSLPAAWYADSISDPNASAVGHRWSSESGGFDGAPPVGSYFFQDDTGSSNDWGSLSVVSQTEAEAIALQDSRNSEGRDYLTATGVLVPGIGTTLATWVNVLQGVRATGDVVAGIVEKIVDGNIVQSLSLGLTSSSPAYAWATIDVPFDAEFVTFDLLLSGLDEDDFFAFGIDDTLLLSLGQLHIEDNTLTGVGLLDVSQWAGTTVDFFYGLETAETGRGASIQDFVFLTSTPFTADFDFDGDVDGVDLTQWENSYGVDAMADTDADGDSDGVDFLAWQRQFTGNPSPLETASTQVPEPASLKLFAMCGLLFAYRSRRQA